MEAAGRALQRVDPIYLDATSTEEGTTCYDAARDGSADNEYSDVGTDLHPDATYDLGSGSNMLLYAAANHSADLLYDTATSEALQEAHAENSYAIARETIYDNGTRPSKV